jgi:hypothetical protein
VTYDRAAFVLALATSTIVNATGEIRANAEAAPTDGPWAVARSNRGCITFVGDVMLARGVAREIAARKKSPWTELAGSPSLAPAWVGNFEGAVVPAPANLCAKSNGLCLGVEPRALEWLKGSPFRALSTANNHVSDFGTAGHEATKAALAALDIAPIDEATGPILLNLDGSVWALISINLAGNSARDRQTALERARLQIGLARAQTERVVVLPHWGREGKAFPAPEQELWADLFTRWGATLIAGSHAHVVQPGRCGPEVATYFGLGNLLFDEAGAPTREGLAVTCCPDEAGFRCSTTRTVRSVTSVYPTVEKADREAWPETPDCSVRGDAADRRWLIHPARESLAFVQPFAAAGPDSFFALRRHSSSFDHEDALRPYVFRVGGRSGSPRVIDVWRGTALARPLVAARLFEWRGSQLLCAIHRDDSFLDPHPQTTKRVRIVYRWTGFGFKGVNDEEALQACEQY